jgi:hypothetical protein
VRVWSGEADNECFYTVDATTPVSAAMKVFFELHKTWPEVVELDRKQIVGYSLTVVTLTAAETGDVLHVEVEDSGLTD